MKTNINKTKKKKIKYFFITSLIVIFFIFLSNFFIGLVQNTAVSILNSNKFERFLIFKIDNILEKMSDGKLSEEEIDYYSNIFNKIYKKYKPVLENIEKN